jgi:outer membrane protein
MRAFIGAAVLSVMLAAAPSFAQAPAPAPAAPAPAAQTPAPAPPTATQVTPAFPVGSKYALINIQRLAAESAIGKAANLKVQALQQQRLNELNARNTLLQGLQAKLEAGANVLSLNAAADLQKQIERASVDIQRFTEDAQQEVTNLTTQLQAEFEQALTPVITAVAKERELHFIFSMADAGIVWWDPSLDISGEVIARFNASQPAAAAPAPRPAAPAAQRPAAPAPAAPQVPVRP